MNMTGASTAGRGGAQNHDLLISVLWKPLTFGGAHQHRRAYLPILIDELDALPLVAEAEFRVAAILALIFRGGDLGLVNTERTIREVSNKR